MGSTTTTFDARADQHQDQDHDHDQQRMAQAIRRWVIEQSLASEVGHIGSALSIVELLAVTWGRVLRNPGTDDPDRDRFILAKGHAALALYAAMRWQGLIEAEEFQRFCSDGTMYAVHPEFGLPGVEVGTGSLGQGLSVGCGLAWSLRRRSASGRVFVLMSDAECNEGQVWEAAMFAAHHRLTNLIALIDLNGMQALGPTGTIIDMHPMADRWRAFGWQAIEADGHDLTALHSALTDGIAGRTGPAVVVCRTVLGKGVSFMENHLEWHYRNLTPDLAATALQEIG
jgi:transketolase